jgi:hypothetical protein
MRALKGDEMYIRLMALHRHACATGRPGRLWVHRLTDAPGSNVVSLGQTPCCDLQRGQSEKTGPGLTGARPGLWLFRRGCRRRV